MIKKRLEKNIEEFIGISEKIAVLDIRLPGYKHKWSFIQVYAPTERQHERVKDIFYDQLSSVLQDAHKNITVIGDFNGRIGSQRTGEENIIGQLLSFRDRTDIEIKSRAACAWKRYWSLKENGSHVMVKKRGRHTRRWTDDIKMIGGTIWSRKATNKEEWKQLEEAYVSQDTLTTEPGNPI
ncbi:hypothetical protein EVAR_35522_1 [Eumeta japonica]|uniref:Craniofacial development protein 2 n=1 Tax=Eumeta variegata TaxID=151549 RepID=A0A4C1X6F4_EUMVA|nr:hypothetical protein EVAR_35522_1 [Eumeta japonica]